MMFTATYILNMSKTPNTVFTCVKCWVKNCGGFASKAYGMVLSKTIFQMYLMTFCIYPFQLKC